MAMWWCGCPGSCASAGRGRFGCFDAESGRAYYFNNKSGESSWDPPAEAPPGPTTQQSRRA